MLSCFNFISFPGPPRRERDRWRPLPTEGGRAEEGTGRGQGDRAGTLKRGEGLEFEGLASSKIGKIQKNIGKHYFRAEMSILLPSANYCHSERFPFH